MRISQGKVVQLVSDKLVLVDETQGDLEGPTEVVFTADEVDHLLEAIAYFRPHMPRHSECTGHGMIPVALTKLTPDRKV